MEGNSTSCPRVHFSYEEIADRALYATKLYFCLHPKCKMQNRDISGLKCSLDSRMTLEFNPPAVKKEMQHFWWLDVRETLCRRMWKKGHPFFFFFFL